MPSIIQTWTTDRIEALKIHFAAGLSCREIAAEIGVSRNAVIGKIARLNLTRDKGVMHVARKEGSCAKPRPRGAQRLRQILLKSFPAEKDKRGAIVVDRNLACPSFPGLWALGDCAAVVDAKSGKPCAPTAQFALREAATLAKNIRASLQGRQACGFRFDSLGALCVVGHQTACAELTVPFARSKSMHFSGLLAWLMWRGIYLGKLPGLERKVRVLVDWTVELFFPKDIVQTIDLR